VRTLVSAWKHIEKLPLKIVGDGELRGELEAQVRADGSRVEFYGYRPRAEVMFLVARAQLQVVPSECYEGFPLVILEAYACGTPVLAAAIGSLQELVSEGVTGRKFRSGDAADLVAKLSDMLADPQGMAAMGRRAREQVLERYTAEQNYAQLMDIYQQARAEAVNAHNSRRKDPAPVRE
jgi:glycosyltransferase involved in cell wall biosynthesis